MAHRNKVIEVRLREKLIQRGITGHATVPLYIICGLPCMIYEELVIARLVAQHTEKMAALKRKYWPKNLKYESLSRLEQLAVRKFYDVHVQHHSHKMTIMAIESSIMLCFQTALLGFNFLQPPLRELYYQKESDIDELPTVRWICLNIIFGLIKIAMSGYLTFALLTLDRNIRSYFHYFKPAGLFTQLGAVTKAILQIVAGTGYVFLSRSQITTQRGGPSH